MTEPNTHHVIDDYGNESQHATSREAHREAAKMVNPRVEVRDCFGRVVSTYETR
jgi:hypothetical protein